MTPADTSAGGGLAPAVEKKRHRSITAWYYLLFAAYGLTFAVLGPTLPALAEGVQASLSAISLLFVARSTGSLLGSLLAGGIYDRREGHRVLVAFQCLLVLTLFVTPSVPVL